MYAGKRSATRSRAFALVAALALTLAASTTVAVAHGTKANVKSHNITKVRELSLEIICQVQNSAPGFAPATSIQDCYISDLLGLPIFKVRSQTESTALFTFYTYTTNVRVIVNAPLKIVNRVGTLTIYSDAAANGNFATPHSFRDCSPVLVASLLQQVIVHTLTLTFTTQNLNTIVSTSPFAGPSCMLPLGSA